MSCPFCHFHVIHCVFFPTFIKLFLLSLIFILVCSFLLKTWQRSIFSFPPDVFVRRRKSSLAERRTTRRSGNCLISQQVNFHNYLICHSASPLLPPSRVTAQTHTTAAGWQTNNLSLRSSPVHVLGWSLVSFSLANGWSLVSSGLANSTRVVASQL